MNKPESIAFVLYSEADDPFGKVYQDDMHRVWNELREGGLQTSPPETKMPMPAAGGGWVTEYLIPGAAAASTVITAITPIIQTWMKRGKDHQVRLKMGDLQVMTNSKEEAEEELKKLMEFQKQKIDDKKQQSP